MSRNDVTTRQSVVDSRTSALKVRQQSRKPSTTMFIGLPLVSAASKTNISALPQRCGNPLAERAHADHFLRFVLLECQERGNEMITSRGDILFVQDIFLGAVFAMQRKYCIEFSPRDDRRGLAIYVAATDLPLPESQDCRRTSDCFPQCDRAYLSIVSWLSGSPSSATKKSHHMATTATRRLASLSQHHMKQRLDFPFTACCDAKLQYQKAPGSKATARNEARVG
ncbi:hypothetical protein [Variovorax sp. W6]|uniref:hypothetical protein n=1 Tax=Variovorax sp. W6 TaxID=3093895 RepID=UPI003D807EDD